MFVFASMFVKGWFLCCFVLFSRVFFCLCFFPKHYFEKEVLYLKAIGPLLNVKIYKSKI